MIHSYQSEGFVPAIEATAVNTTRTANSAVRNNYRLAANCIYHLVMITDQLNWVGFRFAINSDANNEFAFVNALGGSNKGSVSRLKKFSVCCDAKVQDSEYRNIGKER